MKKLVKEMQVQVLVHGIGLKCQYQNYFFIENLHANENFMLRYATVVSSTLVRKNHATLLIHAKLNSSNVCKQTYSECLIYRHSHSDDV